MNSKEKQAVQSLVDGLDRLMDMVSNEVGDPAGCWPDAWAACYGARDAVQKLLDVEES